MARAGASSRLSLRIRRLRGMPATVGRRWGPARKGPEDDKMLALLLLFAAAPADRAEGRGRAAPAHLRRVRHARGAPRRGRHPPTSPSASGGGGDGDGLPGCLPIVRGGASRRGREADAAAGRASSRPARAAAAARLVPAACGGDHHAYPGGLAVHAWADLLHARGPGGPGTQQVYGVKLRDDWLVAAALVARRAQGGDAFPGGTTRRAGPEPSHRGNGARTTCLGAGRGPFVRRLPEGLVLTVASAPRRPVFPATMEAPSRSATSCARPRSLPTGSLPAGACPGQRAAPKRTR